MNCRLLLKLISASASLFLLATATTCCFAGPKVSSPGELAVVEGRISSYSFLDDSKGIHQYAIHLSEYAATFQIPAEFANYFAKGSFESNLLKGDTLSVSIPADSAGKLASGGMIPIFAARTKTASYLDEHYTLYAHDEELNNATSAGTTNATTRGAHSPTLMSFAIPLVTIVFISLVIGVAVTMWKSKIKPAPGLDGAVISESTQRMKRLVTKDKPNSNEPTQLPLISESEPGENPQEPTTAQRT
jgi:hypothetical protein